MFYIIKGQFYNCPFSFWEGEFMTTLLYWLEPKTKWETRGYANNQYLRIDYDAKKYSLTTGWYVPNGSDSQIEVLRKSELKQYIGYLKKCGFNENLT